MLSEKPKDRALPTFITLLVIGILLMTFDVRLEGGGVVSSLRTGTLAIVAPIQRAAATVVNPVADMIESLSNVASLREQNIVLKAELADAEAQLVAVQDRLARLELLEKLQGLDIGDERIGRTEAEVIGWTDGFNESFFIDKGTSDGIVPGQPVIDINGYVVGRIKTAAPGSATVVPITVSRAGISVLVGSQVGTVTSQLNQSEMKLDIPEAREPVVVGDRVVTSALSSAFPAGLAVGEVIQDSAPSRGSLTTEIRPFVDTATLRIVVVLAWPPDPVSIATDNTVPPVPTATTTTQPSSTTTLPESTS